MDTEHDGPGHGDVSVSLSWPQGDGSFVYQSWIVCECAHLLESFARRLGPPLAETVASAKAVRESAEFVRNLPGAVHTRGGFE